MTSAPDTAAPLARYRLTICGLDELADHTGASVSHTVSILDPEQPLPRVFRTYDSLREHWVLRFHDLSQPVRGARLPAEEDIAELLTIGRALAPEAKDSHILVHCHAGVSRSTAAAAILLTQHHYGSEREALREVVRLRPIAFPNARMIRLADEMLGRNGALTDALAEVRGG